MPEVTQTQTDRAGDPRMALPSRAEVRDRLVEILTCHVVAAEAFSTAIAGKDGGAEHSAEVIRQKIKLMVQNFTESDKQGRYTFSLAKSLLLEERTFAALQEEFEKFENTHQLDFCIELPESFIADEQAMAKRYVDLIKAHGYRFGIGEFSAESENLAYLERFRPEFIKISKLYLLDMIEKESPLLASLQMAADSLGIRIIATGVTNREELETIRTANIDTVQGFITEIV